MAKEIELHEALDTYHQLYDKKLAMEKRNDTGINYKVLVSTLATMDKGLDEELDRLVQEVEKKLND